VAPGAEPLILGTTLSLVSAGGAFVAIAVAAASAVGIRIYKTLADGYRTERDLALERATRLELEKSDLSADVETLVQKVRDLESLVQELRLKDVSALFDLMQAHDQRTTEAGAAILAGLQHVVQALDRVATAVVPPAHVRD
jgi:uncharacterized protein YlxW (UPF0749 family)